MTTAGTHEVDAVAFDELIEGRGRCVDLDQYSLALFRRGDEVFALENACPHRGGPLCEGDVQEGVVYCPLHAWGFDLRSGRAVNVRWEGARVFPVRVQAGRVLVVLPDAGAAMGGSDPWLEE
jgi:nitrite reductase (NADH) small subunit